MARIIWSIASVATVLSLIAPPTLAQNEQQPLAHDDVDKIEENKMTMYPSRDAQLTIYNDPKWPCVRQRGRKTTELDVPVNNNICLSANFTLDDNVHLQHPGLCPGGTSYPYISIYKTADCTGEYSHPTWYDRPFATIGPGQCLSKAIWRDLAPPEEEQFSMSFRCDEAELEKPRQILEISLPQIPRAPKPRPKSRPNTASVSDSACYIPGMGMAGAPKFIFQRPEADTCVNVAPKHSLKIYRNALCANGTEALWARWQGKGCKGDPVVLKEVGKDMMATNLPDTCIKMGGEEASSYAFWCTGDLQERDTDQSLFSNDDEGENVVRIQYSFGNRPAVQAKSDARSWGVKGELLLVVVAAALVVL